MCVCVCVCLSDDVSDVTSDPVGEPISVPQISEPSADEVDRYHALYMASLQRLFDTEKTRFGLTQRDTLLMH